MSFETTNPYGFIFDALWKRIEADTVLAGLIKPGNRVKLVGESVTRQIPMKATVQDGDMPELTIEPSGSQERIHMTSDSAILTQDLRFTIVSGNLMTEIIHGVKWALLQLLSEVMTDRLNIHWVTRIDLNARSDEGYDAAQAENRGTSGWSLGLVLTIEFSVHRDQASGRLDSPL